MREQEDARGDNQSPADENTRRPDRPYEVPPIIGLTQPPPTSSGGKGTRTTGGGRGGGIRKRSEPDT